MHIIQIDQSAWFPHISARVCVCVRVCTYKYAYTFYLHTNIKEHSSVNWKALGAWLVDSDWFWLILIDSDWFWLILIDSDWFWNCLVFLSFGFLRRATDIPRSSYCTDKLTRFEIMFCRWLCILEAAPSATVDLTWKEAAIDKNASVCCKMLKYVVSIWTVWLCPGCPFSWIAQAIPSAQNGWGQDERQALGWLLQIAL